MRVRPVSFVCAPLITLFLAGLVGASPVPAIGFLPAAGYPLPTTPYAVAVGDFNNDGTEDLVSANSDNWLGLFLGAGEGTFAPCALIVGRSAHDVEVADLNGDGTDDIVTADPFFRQIHSDLGVGDGSFTHGGHVGTSRLPFGGSPIDVSVGDFNGDGKPDVAAANMDDATAGVLLGDGSGGFTLVSELTTGAKPMSAAIADLDGDGKQDLIIPNYDANSVSVFLGDGGGGFGARLDVPAGPQPHAVAAADLNNDDKQDLVLASSDLRSQVSTTVLLGNGDGTFQGYVGYGDELRGGSVEVVDLDGDGVQDVVRSNLGWGMSVLLGKGDGTLKKSVTFATDSYPNSVAIADFDGDGALDVATACSMYKLVDVLLQVPDSFTITPLLVGVWNVPGEVAPANQQTVARNSTPTFTFSPHPGYHVSAVRVDGTKVSLSVTNSYTFSPVTADHSLSVAFAANPKPRLERPICPVTVRAGASLKVYGELWPRFPAGAKTVTVKAYRYANSKWSLYKTCAASNSNYSGHSRYSAKLSSARKGKYRFRAFTDNTARWAATKSIYSRILTVK